MNTLDAILTVLTFVLVFPIVVYVSVKLGTYAYFAGKRQFERDQKHGED